jgi:glycine/D-amino acid oxidase-like deaminating enzyme
LQSVHVCHYANTPSGDFLVDRHPRLDNVWFVGGGSGHGFKHGQAIAEYFLNVIDNGAVPELRFLLCVASEPITFARFVITRATEAAATGYDVCA